MDLANLRRLAAADPYPNWEPGSEGMSVLAREPFHGIRKVADLRGWSHLERRFGGDKAAEIQNARAAFIASCSPANILELLDELDRQRAFVQGPPGDGPLDAAEYPIAAPLVNALRRLRAVVLANTPGGEGLDGVPDGQDSWEAWETAVKATLDEAEGRALRAEEQLLEQQARRECSHCAAGRPLGTVTVQGRETLRHALAGNAGITYARCHAELVRKQLTEVAGRRRRAQKALKESAA